MPVPGEEKSLSEEEIAATAGKLGIAPVWNCDSAASALARIKAHNDAPCRILITGSLYLAGWILRDHG